MGEQRHELRLLEDRQYERAAPADNFDFAAGAVIRNMIAAQEGTGDDHPFIRSYGFVTRPERNAEYK
ncbi:hypothetical protein D3C86_1853700 [compost metagenome]